MFSSAKLSLQTSFPEHLLVFYSFREQFCVPQIYRPLLVFMPSLDSKLKIENFSSKTEIGVVYKCCQVMLSLVRHSEHYLKNPCCSSRLQFCCASHISLFLKSLSNLMFKFYACRQFCCFNLIPSPIRLHPHSSLKI